MLSASFLLFVFHLQEPLRLSPLEAGLLLLPLAVGLVVAVTVVPGLLGGRGARVCSLSGIAFAAGGMAGIALAAHFDFPPRH